MASWCSVRYSWMVAREEGPVPVRPVPGGKSELFRMEPEGAAEVIGQPQAHPEEGIENHPAFSSYLYSWLQAAGVYIRLLIGSSLTSSSPYIQAPLVSTPPLPSPCHPCTWCAFHRPQSWKELHLQTWLPSRFARRLLWLCCCISTSYLEGWGTLQSRCLVAPAELAATLGTNHVSWLS